MKYDKCLNINVGSFSSEKKKLVQDAFFKLGYSWNTNRDCSYRFIEDQYQYYTNHSEDDKFPTALMYAIEKKQNKYTVTFNQLMEIASMTEHKENTFSKSDLKTGMVVKLKGFSMFWMIIGDRIVGNGFNWMPFDKYNDDLTYTSELGSTKIYDIIEVYETTINTLDLEKLNKTLVWERKTETPQQKELRLLEDKQRELAKQQQDLADQMKILRGSV